MHKNEFTYISRKNTVRYVWEIKKKKKYKWREKTNWKKGERNNEMQRRNWEEKVKKSEAKNKTDLKIGENKDAVRKCKYERV